ncbi:MAG: type II toxin-antitoxin system VapC family toxin [Bacillota bacterium]
MSTLTFAETLSVLRRMRSAGVIDEATLQDALDLIRHLPWRRFPQGPAWDDIASVSSTYGLRGADLWHLCTALTLKKRLLPSLRLLSYDSKLVAAAAEVDLAP